MNKRPATLAVAAGTGLLAAVTVCGAAYAAQGGWEGTMTRAQIDRATAAALAFTPGGKTPHSVERDAENGATWEVEVTRTNGQTVDVRLDGDYRLVVIEGDFEKRPAPSPSEVVLAAAG